LLLSVDSKYFLLVPLTLLSFNVSFLLLLFLLFFFFIGEESIRHLLTDLIDKSQKDEAVVRLEACEYINIFCTESKANFSSFLNNLITSMLARFSEADTSIVSSAWGALDGVMKSIKKEELPQYAGVVRKALRHFIGEGKTQVTELKGFCLPKVPF
jgi:hypothetical protein